MIKSVRTAAVLAAFAAATAFSGAASAANTPFTFSDSNSGNGYLSGSLPTITLTGSDNWTGSSMTEYTATFTTAETVIFNWSYTTQDWNGAYDPAGYTLNGALYQLSSNSAATGETYFGSSTVTVHAGDTFGWYDFSVDSEYGASALSVNVTSMVPEPANMLLLLAGLGALGVVARRRKSA